MCERKLNDSVTMMHFSSKWRELNHNVRLILIIVLFAGLSESLGFGSALSAFGLAFVAALDLDPGFGTGFDQAFRPHARLWDRFWPGF